MELPMQNKKPRFSLVLPVYNVEQYLEECLNSIVNQTFTDFEAICINDGSTDNSLEILNKYATKDNRFVVITQENQGQGVARNNAIDLAKGDYLIFIDPDDWIELNTLEVLDKKFTETGAEIIHFENNIYNEINNTKSQSDFMETSKKNLGYQIENESYYSWENFQSDNFFTKFGIEPWRKAYSTKFIKENNIKFAPNKYSEDHIFSISILLLASRIYFINTHLYFYRIRLGSIVNSASDGNFCVFENIKTLKNFLINQELFEQLEKQYRKYVTSVLGYHITCVPTKSIPKFKQKCAEFLGKEEYKHFLKTITPQHSFTEQIFCIKNRKINGKKRKYIKVLGFQFYLN